MLHEIDLSRVDLNLLVLFESVMEARHVGRAAAGLNLSPSAVSHALGRLRTLLGDPLFLRTPKGVVPTDRAEQLAPLVAEVLARVRDVVASARPFDPSRSTRRFVVGAPDGVSAVFLPPLLRHVREAAPNVGIGIRQLLPMRGEVVPSLAWGRPLADLEARACDVAVLPVEDVPKRFAISRIYSESFVVAMRAGHPFGDEPSLRSYCEMEHILVSETGDATGIVDAALAARGLSRRIALTVPNFMLALALLADTDVLCAVPRRLVARYDERFGIVAAEVPIELPRYELNIIVPKVAMADTALAWFAETLQRATGDERVQPIRTGR